MRGTEKDMWPFGFGVCHVVLLDGPTIHSFTYVVDALERRVIQCSMGDGRVDLQVKRGNVLVCEMKI